LCLRGSGIGLRLSDPAASLTPFTGTYLFTDPIDGAAVFTSYETGRRYRVTVLAGAHSVSGSEVLGRADRSVLLGGDGAGWEAEIREDTSQRTAAPTDFDGAVRGVGDDFGSYLQDIAPWRDGRTPAAARAAYVLWSATVAPAGLVNRET